MKSKEEMIKIIRLYKNTGLKEAIKIYNEMNDEDKQNLLEKIAENTMDFNHPNF